MSCRHWDMSLTVRNTTNGLRESRRFQNNSVNSSSAISRISWSLLCVLHRRFLPSIILSSSVRINVHVAAATIAVIITWHRSHSNVTNFEIRFSLEVKKKYIYIYIKKLKRKHTEKRIYVYTTFCNNTIEKYAWYKLKECWLSIHI